VSGGAAPHLLIAGLGPGAAEHLTPEVAAALAGGGPVLLRTRRHPVVAALPGAERWPSLDDLYDTAASFDDLYAAMVARLRQALDAAGGPVVYAVPGHPLFAEASVRLALAAGLPARVLPGLSLLDAVAATLRRDPVAEGWQVIDALDLAAAVERHPFGAGTLPFVPVRPALVCQVYNRRVASLVKLALTRVLPDDHPVTLVRAAGVAGEERVLPLPLYALDRADDHADHLTSLLVPAQAPLAAPRAPETLLHIVARLRAPGGCPWDREQTHRSLAPHVVEEAYEVVEAIEQDDPAALAEELGDLLLQVVLHAQLAEEEGTFLFEDVLEAISTKLIRRHPHVFGELMVSGSGEVLRNWDAIKAAEREAKGAAAPASPFDSVARSLPALSRAQTFLRRAERLGHVPAAPAALAEDLRAAALALAIDPDPTLHQEYLGQVLLGAVELARARNLDAETALRAATDAFRQRVES
jgi:tetrapyrrole methylase family protein / MazG family protein